MSANNNITRDYFPIEWKDLTLGTRQVAEFLQQEDPSMTIHKLIAWDRRGYVAPWHPASGHGTRRKWRILDAFLCFVMVRCQHLGLSPRTIKDLLNKFREFADDILLSTPIYALDAYGGGLPTGEDLGLFVEDEISGGASIVLNLLMLRREFIEKMTGFLKSLEE